MSTKNYPAMINLLEIIKAERIQNKNETYVCDMVRFRRYSDNYVHADKEAICEDINKYIKGYFSMMGWLRDCGFDVNKNDDPIVQDARMVMIDTLIERYKKEVAQ